MFETFEVPSMFLGVQSNLALYATGRTTGLAVDIGEEVSHAVPVIDSYSNIPHRISRSNVGGKDVTSQMLELMGQRGNVLPDKFKHLASKIK